MTPPRKTAKRRKPPNRKTISSFAAMGGEARAKKLSPERRKAIAIKASEARWKPTPAQPPCAES